MYEGEKISANRASVSDMLHNRHLSDGGRTDGYMTITAARAEPSGVNELQTLERSPGSSTSFLLLLFKSSFPIQTLIFPVQRRKQQKPSFKREAMNTCRKTRQDAGIVAVDSALKYSPTKKVGSGPLK